MQAHNLESYFATLISQRTVSADHQTLNASIDYLQNFFAERNLYTQRYDFNGYGALVATTVKDSKTPRIALTVHIDVVPATDDLFTLRLQDGKYFGRGVYDMKFALATYMAVIDALFSEGTLSEYDLGIIVTTDEEIGGHNGILRLVDMGYKPAICVLPDGGENWNIETLAKGVSYGHLYADGKTAHGSRPWEGESAILKLMDALKDLRELFADQKLMSNTLNIGKIDGGEAINQIPSAAHATLDIRYMRHEDRLHLYDQMQAMFERHDVRYEEEFYDKPCVTDLEHPLVKSFIDSVEHITGQRPSGTLSVGGSDARHLAKYDIQAILTHPEGGNQHAAGEWISKKGVHDFYDVLIDYLNKVARTQ